MVMSRTIELGRAVIALQSSEIELWLTTLITLLPQQDANNFPAQQNNANFQDLEPDVLLDYLSSGNVWVGRGHAMHMTFDMTKYGPPLGNDSILQLGNSIINAPAWKQFGLRLTIPLNFEPSNGKLRINIDLCRENNQTLTTADQVNLPSVHVRPPEELPVVLLQSIEFVTATFQMNCRAASPKRPKRQAPGRTSGALNTSAFPDIELPDANPFTQLNPMQSSSINDIQSSPQDESGRDNLSARRTGTLKTSDSGTDRTQTTVRANPGKRKRSTTISKFNRHVPADGPVLSGAETLTVFTDAALRLSICPNMRGSASGLKVKASTFKHCLANIAPALWRPGFLSTCFQASHLAPAIARSLGRISFAARSTTLKSRLASCTNGPSRNTLNQGVAGEELGHSVESAITARVWVHNQKIQMAKALPGSIQALCTLKLKAASVEEHEEILEEYRDFGLFEHRNEVLDLEELPPTGDYSYAFHEVDTLPSVDMKLPNTTKSQNETSYRSISSTIIRRFTSLSHVSEDEDVEDDRLLFDRGEAVKRNRVDNPSFPGHCKSTDIARASQVSLPGSDDEGALFSF